MKKLVHFCHTALYACLSWSSTAADGARSSGTSQKKTPTKVDWNKVSKMVNARNNSSQRKLLSQNTRGSSSNSYGNRGAQAKRPTAYTGTAHNAYFSNNNSDKSTTLYNANRSPPPRPSYKSTSSSKTTSSKSSFSTGSASSQSNVAATVRSNDYSDIGIKESDYHWMLCGKEYDTCPVRDCKVIRYGQPGGLSKWVMRKVPSGTTEVVCTNGFFKHDPLPGRTKMCYCGMEPNYVPPNLPKFASVSLTANPPALEEWIRYHVKLAGVSKMYLVIEDEPTRAAFQDMDIVKEFKDYIHLIEPLKGAWIDKMKKFDFVRKEPGNYWDLQRRQQNGMLGALIQGIQDGIEWLVHMDDDEYLYPKDGWGNEPIPDHLKIRRELSVVAPSLTLIRMQNHEIIYDDDVSLSDPHKCLRQGNYVITNPNKHLSYANGKPIVRVSSVAYDDPKMPGGKNSHLMPFGPHFWQDDRKRGSAPTLPWLDADGNKRSLRMRGPVALLHYESCPLKRWREKFCRLNDSPRKKSELLKQIPFAFYKDSSDIIERCGKCNLKQEEAIKLAHAEDEKNNKKLLIQAPPTDDEIESEDDVAMKEYVGSGEGGCNMVSFWKSKKTTKRRSILATEKYRVEIPWDSLPTMSYSKVGNVELEKRGENILEIPETTDDDNTSRTEYLQTTTAWVDQNLQTENNSVETTTEEHPADNEPIKLSGLDQNYRTTSTTVQRKKYQGTTEQSPQHHQTLSLVLSVFLLGVFLSTVVCGARKSMRRLVVDHKGDYEEVKLEEGEVMATPASDDNELEEVVKAPMKGPKE